MGPGRTTDPPGTTAPPAFAGRLDLLDLLVLAALAAIAAAARFTNLATRASWDSDQGHDMLVLRALVRDGTIPLLGPPTSIGDVHHGAVYYYLLAPAAFASGADPYWIAAFIAACGVGAVMVTWWLARSIGGRTAGLAAGLVLALSASAIDESTFIWNPNLIALSSALALAGGWQAWTTGRARWWLLAAIGTTITIQCHILGVVLLPPVAALLVADFRRGDERARRRLLLASLAWAAILGASLVPLAIHEATTNVAELRAAAEYLAAGGEPATLGPIGRFLVIALRIAAWPLTGLVTDAPEAAILSVAVVAAIIVWRWRSPERVAVRWLGLTLCWSALALTFAAPGLATVVPGLPNDHYHAFLDPVVVIVVGLGVAALARLGLSEEHALASGRHSRSAEPLASGRHSRSADPLASSEHGTLDHEAHWLPRSPRKALGGLAAVACVGILLAWNLARWPPAVAADGGWPVARGAALRILASTRGLPIVTLDRPAFKTTEGIDFPLLVAGATVEHLPGVVPEPEVGRTSTAAGAAIVVLCDRLFEHVMAGRCGGPLEDEAVVAATSARGTGPPPPLALRFALSARIVVSVYVPSP